LKAGAEERRGRRRPAARLQIVESIEFADGEVIQFEIDAGQGGRRQQHEGREGQSQIA
jgi:hypothetical protein